MLTVILSLLWVSRYFSRYIVNPLWERVISLHAIPRNKQYNGQTMIFLVLISSVNNIFSTPKQALRDTVLVVTDGFFDGFIFNKIKTVFHIVENIIADFLSFISSKQ